MVIWARVVERLEVRLASMPLVTCVLICDGAIERPRGTVTGAPLVIVFAAMCEGGVELFWLLE